MLLWSCQKRGYQRCVFCRLFPALPSLSPYPVISISLCVFILRSRFLSFSFSSYLSLSLPLTLLLSLSLVFRETGWVYINFFGVFRHWFLYIIFALSRAFHTCANGQTYSSGVGSLMICLSGFSLAQLCAVVNQHSLCLVCHCYAISLHVDCVSCASDCVCLCLCV